MIHLSDLGMSYPFHAWKKIFYSALALVFYLAELKAQSTRQTDYVVSPTTASLTKAGQVSLNLSAGQLDYSIPFYEIRLGDFHWPIRLNYQYSGLRLEELTGEVGLGWSFDGLGATVTRQVRGLPDEHPRGYYGAESRRNYVFQSQSIGDLPLQIIQDFTSGLYDSEPDKFIVTVGDLSFSFFISSISCSTCPLADQQLSVSSNADLAKINFNWNRIEVIDADGVQYIFEEIERSTFYSSDLYNQEKMQDYPSAWHISSIKIPSGQQAIFQYQHKIIQQFSHSEIYERTLNPNGERIQVNCSSLGGINNSGYSKDLMVRDLNHQQFWSATEIDTPLLESISWEAENKLTIFRNQNFNSRLIPLIQSVEITNSRNRKIKSAALSYQHQARSLLSRVTINQDEIYDFSYYPVNIPLILQPLSGAITTADQNPYAQDYWGYANGKGNPSSIPELGGDRRSDFISMIQGALREINWPTGGATKIDYEQNEVRISAEDFLDIEPIAPNREFTFSLFTENREAKSSSATFEFKKVTYAKISHQALIRGTSSFLTAEFIPRSGCAGINCQTYYTYAEQMRSKYPEQAPRFVPVFGVSLTGDVITTGCGDFQACAYEDVDQWIRIEPGIYLVEASIRDSDYGLFRMYINFFDPDPENKSPAFYAVPSGGIRVARTKDCPDPGSESGCTQKMYRYVAEDGFSSGMNMSKLDLEFNYQVYDAVDCRERSGPNDSGSSQLPLLFEWNYPAIRKSFRSINPIVFHAGSPVYYSRVEILDDLLAMTGREVRYFKPTTWGLTGSYPFVPVPRDLVHGVVWKTEWNNRDGDNVKNLVSEHSVRGIAAAIPPGLVFGISRQYRYIPILFSQQPEETIRSSYLMQKYLPEQSTKRLLLSERESDTPGISRARFFRYNSQLQLAADSITDRYGNTIVNQYQYPQEISDPLLQALALKNRIAQPVRTSRIINGKVRRVKQTIFKDWMSDGQLVEPLRQEMWKDGIQITEKEIQRYHSKGKPVNWTERDGLNRTLIWDENQEQILAEILGASPEEVFYTSFEKGDQEGNTLSGDGHCGLKSKVGGFLKTLTGLNPEMTYRLTWFEKISDGQWLLRTQEIKLNKVSTYTINLSGQVDDIRFHPAYAQMTSYTSEPLVGISSKIGPDLQTTYYEYDESGRLINVRDQNKKILQSHQYQYGKKL